MDQNERPRITVIIHKIVIGLTRNNSWKTDKIKLNIPTNKIIINNSVVKKDLDLEILKF
ncbi:12948_t:CDS:2 [Dentiscutata erythropus]|uniref:12948_t:CDS:1 n=1 Tax=Dentiscutata erythropus TaxID=1348616 RepID=A0A9N9FCX8_9GLOM|nr:12948_t:CDS:2 [Dentiscutata erythropus]